MKKIKMKQKTNKRKKKKKQTDVRLIDLIFDGLSTLRG